MLPFKPEITEGPMIQNLRRVDDDRSSKTGLFFFEAQATNPVQVGIAQVDRPGLQDLRNVA